MRHPLLAPLVTAALLAPASAVSCAEPFDVLLRGGRVVDGTGAPSYLADVGIRDGLIAGVGRLGTAGARLVVDVEGLVVAPGFVDLMGQSARVLLEDPSAAMNLLTQGVTTINCGEGDSDAPLEASQSATTGWTTLAEYLQLLDLAGLPVNVVQTVGLTQVRRLVLGDSDRQPGEQELEAMKALVAEGMEAGAIGVSTALIYPPAAFSSTRELSALASVAGKSGGGYFTHLRNEGDRLLEAVEEALQIGREARAPVHIFHLKAAGQANWPKMAQALERLRAARTEGIDVTADIYPYINNGLDLDAFLPPEHFARGREQGFAALADESVRKKLREVMESSGSWENWYRHVGGDWGKVVLGRTGHALFAPHAGRSLAEAAAACGKDSWTAFFELVPSGTFVLPQSMTEANLALALRDPSVAFCTDVGPAGGSAIASHPRAFGSFPRVFARLVRELGTLSLEEAVSRAAARAASQVLVHDRGRIALGLAADLVVFHPTELRDLATFEDPRKVSVGMRHVLVNGAFVLRDGRQQPARPGRVLRGPGWKPPGEVATGPEVKSLLPIDGAIRRFLTRTGVPGAAVAITERGRLVYARGFGHADLERRAPVEPTSLFRIASVSKPITAAAILQLVEEGKLGLDDRIFDHLPFEPHLEPGASVDERQRTITVRQLLQHRGGWDRDATFDPMFQAIRFARALGAEPPASQRDIMRIMSGRALDFDPGSRYAYSNYGYCLLGRLIEKLRELPYEEAVLKHLLGRLGKGTFRLGRTQLPNRAPGEVRYYAPEWGPSCFAAAHEARTVQPYGPWCLESMDAHGGWLASAVDLARFAAALDAPGARPLLAPQSLALTEERPAGESGNAARYYGLGWQVTVKPGAGARWEHGGSLPGTSTLLVRRGDGKSLVILLNTRASPQGLRLDTTLASAVEQAMGEITTWPEEDLFSRY